MEMRGTRIRLRQPRTPKSERRHGTRIACQFPVEIAISGRKSIRGSIQDISRTGMRITADPGGIGQLDDGEHLFRIPVRRNMVVVPGHVVRRSGRDSVGIAFATGHGFRVPLGDLLEDAADRILGECAMS